MTAKDIIVSYQRHGKLIRSVAKNLVKQLRGGTLATSDFAGSIPFPVITGAYDRFASRYPLKFAAWGAQKRGVESLLPQAIKNLSPNRQGDAVAQPVREIKANEG